MNIFKRITTLSRINDQIYGAEKALIENQGTADHYQAMADGNRVTLKRLRAMRDAEINGRPSSAMTAPVEQPVTTKAKLRTAA